MAKNGFRHGAVAAMLLALGPTQPPPAKAMLEDLIRRATTAGAKMGLLVAWERMGRPIPAHAGPERRLH